MSPLSDPEKPEALQIGNVLATTGTFVEAQPGGFWRRFLKQNPSPDFLADVAKMNGTELDLKEVRRIERKIDLLIMPML